MPNKKLINNCKKLIQAYKSGEIGQTKMPEDSHPAFSNKEERLAYFTLPMALNYQRNSYKLWESALTTFNDTKTKDVFYLEKINALNENELRKKLTKHKLALQPNKQTSTWNTIANTVLNEFGSFEELFAKTNNDFLELKESIQTTYKKGFPYLSGPKIFNYWSHIIQEYGKQKLSNSEFIEIAPDTHVTKCSVMLGVITKEEAQKVSKEEINSRWRKALAESGITPIEMHPPLWFWSKNDFTFKL
jgi:hypothetical protein